ncbi:Uncharacterised protein [Bordetella pertussis]|nr:Uncharacterised protein [Bordetella pertussis]
MSWFLRSRSSRAPVSFSSHSANCFFSPSACSSRYLRATSAWASSLSSWLPSSRRMSSTRVRFSRVSDRRFSVSRRRSL